MAGTLKLAYSQYRELQSFAQFGSDLDADTKRRLAQGERIVEVLKQDRNSPVPVEQQVCILYAVTNDYLVDVPVEQIAVYEQELYEDLSSLHDADVLAPSGRAARFPKGRRPRWTRRWRSSRRRSSNPTHKKKEEGGTASWRHRP